MTALARTRPDLAAARAALPGSVAVVMTMGGLHDGHRRLIETARQQADSVVVTVFVNPLQFGAGEDLGRYPRDFDADLALCQAAGVDLVFAPDVEQMYPAGRPQVTVSAGELGSRFEGASRPGHFDGVLTVVAKLTQLCRPDVAVYGEKDAQQLALIRRMARDLEQPVRIVGVPTVREPDGLALSTRNRYLDDASRRSAGALSRALRAGADRRSDGIEAVLAAARAELAAVVGLDVDYLTLIDDDAWTPATPDTGRGRLLVAARIGTTRLIDNVAIDLGTRERAEGERRCSAPC